MEEKKPEQVSFLEQANNNFKKELVIYEELIRLINNRLDRFKSIPKEIDKEKNQPTEGELQEYSYVINKNIGILSNLNRQLDEINLRLREIF